MKGDGDETVAAQSDQRQAVNPQMIKQRAHVIGQLHHIGHTLGQRGRLPVTGPHRHDNLDAPARGLGLGIGGPAHQPVIQRKEKTGLARRIAKDQIVKAAPIGRFHRLERARFKRIKALRCFRRARRCILGKLGDVHR